MTWMKEDSAKYKEITVRKNGSVRVATINNEPSMTQQQFKEQCDVNNIIAKYKKTGEFVHVTRKNGIYADVSEITDYQQSVDKILKAQSAFATLPSKTRLRFNNDPAQLLEFMQDKNNYNEGVELGLYEKRHDLPDDDAKTKNVTTTKTKTSSAPTPKNDSAASGGE